MRDTPGNDSSPVEPSLPLPLSPAPAQQTRVSIFGPWYFTAQHLHRRPRPLKPISPVYPADANGIGGKVQIRLFISEHGDVDKYEVIEQASSKVFERPTIDAFASARYSPGLITGYPVRSQLLLEVTYEPGLEPKTILITPDEEQ